MQTQSNSQKHEDLDTHLIQCDISLCAVFVAFLLLDQLYFTSLIKNIIDKHFVCISFLRGIKGQNRLENKVFIVVNKNKPNECYSISNNQLDECYNISNNQFDGVKQEEERHEGQQLFCSVFKHAHLRTLLIQTMTLCVLCKKDSLRGWSLLTARQILIFFLIKHVHTQNTSSQGHTARFSFVRFKSNSL